MGTTDPKDTVRRQASGVQADRTTADDLIAALPSYQGLLRLVCWKRGIRGDEAKDLRQEIFLRVIEKIRLDGLSRPDKLADYVYKTAWNISTHYWRQRGRRFRRVDEDEDNDEILRTEPASAPTPEDLTERDQLSHQVREVVGRRMQPRDGEILTRVYLREETHKSARRAMRLEERPFNTVLWRAKARAGRHLEGWQ